MVEVVVAVVAVVGCGPAGTELLGLVGDSEDDPVSMVLVWLMEAVVSVVVLSVAAEETHRIAVQHTRRSRLLFIMLVSEKIAV